jgi:hypothetical protein
VAAPAPPPSWDEREALRHVARHGMVTVEQLAARVGGGGSTLRRRLGLMEAAGLIHVDRVLVGLPPVVRATRRGLEHCGCDLAPASLELGRLRHSLALVDLADQLLRAHPGSAWTTERELRRDRARESRAQGRWEPRRRVPDGLLRLPGGRRIAVELDLTPKRSTRLDLLAGAYAVDPEVDQVWWYLPSERNVRRMEALVAERGLEELIEPRVLRPAGAGPR